MHEISSHLRDSMRLTSALFPLRNEWNTYFSWCRSTYERVLHEYFAPTRCGNV